MSSLRASDGPRRFRAFLLILGIGAGLAAFSPSSAVAYYPQQGTPPTEKKDEKKPDDKKPDEKKPDEKKPEEKKPEQPLIEFAMDGKPWAEVLDWLVEKTGKHLVGNFRPTGSLLFKGPKGKKYTLPQIIDILNEALLTQKYIIIQRPQSIALVPADDKLDRTWIPQVKPEDLEQHGTTEVVQTTLQLSALLAKEAEAEYKQTLGPFGTIVSLERANQLNLMDTVANLKRIRDDIAAREEKEKTGSAETLSYTCKSIRARDAERLLKELLVEKKTGDTQQQQYYDRYGRPLPPPPTTDTRRQVSITFDEIKNMVFVTGPADMVTRARKFLTDIDGKGTETIDTGAPFMKTYTVAPGTVDALARALGEQYKNSTTIKIYPSTTSNSITIFATPADHKEIVKYIPQDERGELKTELVPVGVLDVTKTADTLKAIYGDSKTGGPYIEGIADRNAIVVRGSADQVKEVVNTIKVLGGDVTTGSGSMRIFTLEKGSAATLAEALEKILPEMRKNPVRVIGPTGDTPPPVRPMPRVPDEKDRGTSLGLPEKGSLVASRERNGRKVETIGKMQVAQTDGPLIDPQKDKRPGDAGAPVTITAFGNRLLVNSDDPKALELVGELIRLITATPGGEGDFTVVRLKLANAVEVARVLDEAFNGPRVQQQQQRGGGGNRGGGGGLGGLIGGLSGLMQFAAPGTQAPTDPSKDRIRVVADPNTNSLLVRASPLDLMTIRRLLDKALDTNETDSLAVVRSWVLPVKYASATDVAAVIKDVYSSAISSSSTPAQVTGLPGFMFGGQQQGRQQQQPSGPKQSLSVGVDDRTNTLVLSCSELLFKDIESLVTRLDEAAKDSNRTVKVVPIKGIDPILVQQAVDAIQGRRTTATSTQRPGGTTPGGMFPGGSFQPGTFPGGGNRGGTFPGGGGNRGGGTRGGGTRGGGGGRRGSLDVPTGPDFFEQRVMDDPQSSLLYDPQLGTTSLESPDNVPLPAPSGYLVPGGAGPLQQISHEEQQQPAQPMQPPPGSPIEGTPVVGPRGQVTAEALEELGIIVISGNNPADVESVLEIIRFIAAIGATSEVKIDLVLLKEADATSVTNTLNQLFSRVNLSPSGNTSITAGAGGGTRFQQPQQPQQQQPGPGGQVPQQPQQPQQAAPAASASNLVLIPLVRFNGILVAAARSRFEDVLKEIQRLDIKTRPEAGLTPFPLKKASATRVATLITSFWATRYPGDTNQIRVTTDEANNTLLVQAAPADMAEIRQLIIRLDEASNEAIHDLRIIPLQYAQADEMAATLLTAISDAIVGTTTTTGPTAPTGPGGPGGPGQIPPIGPAAPGGAGAAGANVTVKTKTKGLNFLSLRRPGAPGVQSNMFEDVQIQPDLRTNSLIIAAPPKTMELIFTLIVELDVLPNSRARINVFTLKKGDVLAVGTMLQQLFGGTTTGAVAPGATPATGTGTTTTTGLAPRITIDQRTNSLIVAAGPTDLEVIDALITKLEDSDVEQRRNEVYLLRNATAVDVANTLNQLLLTSLQQVGLGPQQIGFTELERQVVIIPEPIRNKLLISATPRFFAEIMRLIHELDEESPMVVIQVLLAEVDLDGVEEFGVEFGLQSPVLFQRGLAATNTTVNNTTVPQAGVPGFNFLNPALPLPNSVAVGQSVVGFQGLNSFGVGRTGSTGQGGFVFSAASDTFNLLIRALKTQGRADILSRPQVTTVDNQIARVFVGQSIPILTGTTITVGVAQPNVDYADVGIELVVTPKIHPDGRVVMRVRPSVSSVLPQQVNLGNGFFAPQFSQQTVDTTVSAYDGETVAIGGLISKRDGKDEVKVPWLGDLPVVGSVFRYRTHSKTKQELLVILTPHVVRNRYEAEALLTYESRRIDWMIGDIMKTHGPTGLEPILPPPTSDPASSGVVVNPGLDCGEQPLPVTPPGPSVPQAPMLPTPTPQSGPQPMPVGPGARKQTPEPSLFPESGVAPVVHTTSGSTTRPVPPVIQPAATRQR